MNIFIVTFVSISVGVVLNYFYPIDKVAIFAIDSYTYSFAFKVIFLCCLWVSIVLFLRACALSYFKTFLIGLGIGFFASFASLLLAFIFFYTGGLSRVGFDIFIEMMIEDPMKHILQFSLLSLMLHGWLYGGLTTTLSKFILNNINETKGGGA